MRVEVSNFVGPQILNCSSSVCARRSVGSPRNLEVKPEVVGERAFVKVGGWKQDGVESGSRTTKILGKGSAGKITRHSAEGVESLEIRERLRGFQVLVVAVVCDSEIKHSIRDHH